MKLPAYITDFRKETYIDNVLLTFSNIEPPASNDAVREIFPSWKPDTKRLDYAGILFHFKKFDEMKELLFPEIELKIILKFQMKSLATGSDSLLIINALLDGKKILTTKGVKVLDIDDFLKTPTSFDSALSRALAELMENVKKTSQWKTWQFKEHLTGTLPQKSVSSQIKRKI